MASALFPVFFNLSLTFSIRSWWSAPGLVFADCIQLSIFGYEECNQSVFSIDHLVISMCRVIPCVVEKWCLLWPSWQNSDSLCSASFCTPRPNLPIIQGISWLPTFAFQSPMMNKISFLVLDLGGLLGLHRTDQLLWHQWLRHRFGLLSCSMFCLGMNHNHSVIFKFALKYCISGSFVDYEGHSISLWDSCLQ